MTEPTTSQQTSQHVVPQQAIQVEFDALQANDTWFLVLAPPNCKPIGCKWVYKFKFKPYGSLERHKARLVAKGSSQTVGLDYFKTFSPVVKPTIIRIVLTLAMSKNWICIMLSYMVNWKKTFL